MNISQSLNVRAMARIEHVRSRFRMVIGENFDSVVKLLSESNSLQIPDQVQILNFKSQDRNQYQ